MADSNIDVLEMQKQIGIRIRYLQEEAEISQAKLADHLNINRSVLNRIENGTRSVRDIELIKIADFFKVTTDYILGRHLESNNLYVQASRGLTPEQKRDVLDYIEFKKVQNKKRQLSDHHLS
ncbi:helix-turn-helix domain-containing protein [Lentilactobacillus diolivorans]|uniref:HTH cro/C1-type domain-containing protein n=2 Tax=Lentilactobacillus diolivorans TaxID=179838 RepID=A0A0R1S725_9LACO|nr:helix-turn-helix transcriptional regulator [Lentilactobacillus diolivorans]KRL64393.1 hypothetical protein FC85_GL000903 [Lentilactobacillus diolivorans DSM 14421]MDH5104918.1 helix-turn-helix domain-containing protein [Lentilactobacillus diolivorans]GEP23112.1 hypothetical protein LDI01_07050 [Lentilactobacillus diolivorans]